MPEQILGVTVPRAVREGPLGAFFMSRMGQNLTEKAIIGVVALLAAQLGDDESKLRKRLRRAARDGRLVPALDAAAHAFVRAVREGPPGRQA
jgi:hypothetical protein